ncbi:MULTISPECIES: SPOR domain-containing protein [unclassified Leisingera]|uniref:SPOR domain-containing protein n=1 Tax=unclassified Leisingera TaxID=2614906 RepID=UPI0010119927|nr:MULTISPECIES: SPOR domain-containing protein [unclassified Leisingera]MCF6431424.1 SPOR domain-containing protein [Leisingera sp. MMG026]QAX30420.1 SPOR domain-containing protein [Leisingera sp. NJS204]
MKDTMSTAKTAPRIAAAVLGLLLMAGCEDGSKLAFLQPKAKAGGEVQASSSTKLVERDVEAPDVFQVTEAGLWDGRPSIGGVWVAHPDTKDPERVIIRNNANGQFVIGALFRREREIPGPRLQVSSDAAAALGMLAGAPAELNVTALRREEVSNEPPVEDQTAELPAAEADAEADPAAVLAAAAGQEISETPLDPIAGAAAAIEASAPAVPAQTAPAQAKPAAAPAASAQKSALDKPYIQIGIFSVEANAKRTANMMRSAGMVPVVREQASSGKAFWRVLVGPAQNKTERSQLLKSVKETGFADAYAVTN